ncbi:MAG TPA: tetratricopeptide repeat protein [Roseiflexaceae bacterium]|nr:tetratricopeptide repeat protein [Roseiflexaceae bacterium]
MNSACSHIDTLELLHIGSAGEAARRHLLLLADRHPHDAAVQYATARAHDRLGFDRDAVPFYLAAIQAGLGGDDLRGAYLGLGSAYRALGLYHESADALREGLEHFPDATELRVFLAMTLYNLHECHDDGV